MTEEMQKLYDERVNRFNTATDLVQEPDRVPILSQVSHWAIAYCGLKLEDVWENFDLEAECFVKANTDFFYDGIRAAAASHGTKLSVMINSKEHYVSPNGVTPQHKDHSNMTVEEYEEFYEDPYKLITKMALRKLDYFQENDEEASYATLSHIIKQREINTRETYAIRAVKEQLGLPCVQGAGGGTVFMDSFFDYYRGFTAALADLRRYPEKVLKAIEVMLPYTEAGLPKPGTTLPPFPWAAKQHHVPTFLNAKFFGMVYWPHYRKCVESYFNAGTKYLSNFEGPWAQHYDYLQDLPKSSLVALLEPREYEEFNRRFNGQFSVIAGVPSSTLRFISAEEGIEEAKKVIDLFAPGGGLVFGNDRSFIAPGDVDPDKLRVVHEWVHNNATY
ncbi:MAG: hypothetical protein FWG10_01765 [Eubacteriaceae bacterium]|nr:hypothetical protein [Eubacteriaceae bacterium]